MKLLGLLFFCFAASMAAQELQCPPPVSHIRILSDTYSPDIGVDFHLHHFSAALVPQGKTAPLCYAKLTRVSHGEVFVTAESLTKVFNKRLKATESKIKDLQIATSADGVTLSGNTTKVIPIHFSISGPVTTDGIALQLHAEKFKADGIPLKALLQLIGEHLSSVLSVKNVAGLTVEENTMSFFPAKLAHLEGHISSVATTDRGLTIMYSRGAIPLGRLDAAHQPEHGISTPQADKLKRWTSL